MNTTRCKIKTIKKAYSFYGSPNRHYLQVLVRWSKREKTFSSIFSHFSLDFFLWENNPKNWLFLLHTCNCPFSFCLLHLSNTCLNPSNTFSAAAFLHFYFVAFKTCSNISRCYKMCATVDCKSTQNKKRKCRICLYWWTLPNKRVRLLQRFAGRFKKWK